MEVVRMDALQCLLTRRSCRSYEDKPIPAEIMQELVRLGTKAATGSGMQPWGFVLLEGQEQLEALSSEIKQWVLARLETMPELSQYEDWLKNENYNIFYKAHNVLAIYGDKASPWYVYDCTLCSANIQLAAHAQGLGTCWIGFAQAFMNQPEIKARYNVPANFEHVCTLSMGYAKVKHPEAKRNEPKIFFKG